MSVRGTIHASLLNNASCCAVLFDDLIGQTSLDLEDRVFEPAWKALGVEHETGTRLRLKPVETRFLRIPSSKQIQGSVRMWVDILSSTEAAMYPMLDIMPTPPRKFQLRTIVWKAKGIPIADPVSRMSGKFCVRESVAEVHLHYKGSMNGWCEHHCLGYVLHYQFTPERGGTQPPLPSCCRYFLSSDPKQCGQEGDGCALPFLRWEG